MNVLLIGSGGREHALAWKISQSSLCEKLFILPGNAGTELIGRNIDVSVSDFEEIKNIVLNNNISMVVVGPEKPLVDGIYDFFISDSKLKNVTVIGPSRAGAMLEGSKDFSKEFMLKNSIPTAKYSTFTKENISDAYEFLETLSPPYVLKADGLAAGKGVLILENLELAKKELDEMLTKSKFGNASSKVVIEEYLNGIELSVFVLTDGESYKILPSAKDYKRIGEGDTGLNTGGMGAVSPVPFADNFFMDKVENRIIKPTIKGLKDAKITYQGFIFIGLMNVSGDPYVIEYNVRLGDPESEVVIPRIKSDLLNLFKGISDKTFSEKDFYIDENVAATVMLVSGGYPGNYQKNKLIKGLDECHDSILFHAGTKKVGETYMTNGGRVLAITSFGRDIQHALEKSFKNSEKIDFENKYYRKDIGFDLIPI
ncbi:MAG: phosphoribosylamine--glycine ligase [Flavobacteriales bacterium]|nr:phosphoribosylamine--glycine ligase [Flavobacteriales bacterium]